ncbi:MAG TPA: ATP-binding cassette domain-containing protein [Candidatus Faecousia intestinavium]|nr:ATP-binding cassette domain-containing protein [Candidatus Faecousia intestinavium]
MGIPQQEAKNLEKNQEPVLLRMEGIVKEFPGVKALDGVNLTVRAGTVHALMGENGAGKSTLMKCLFGVYKKDAGKIFLNGEEVNFKNSKEALENGVAMVHQELNQALKRNVMDNMWLGRFPMVAKGLPFTSEKKMYDATMAVFDELGIQVNPKTIMSTMPVSQRQMVEIAKAVSYNSKIIVFDEPTSSLTENEVEHLFKIINMLRSRGCGIIYISHKMEEILRISDDITIMRDGQWIATKSAKELTMDEIIRLMVGRELTNRYPHKDNVVGEELLRVEGLSGMYSHLRDVSFTARKGEILGIAGLDASGRTELLENIFGVATRKSGKIFLGGKQVLNRSATESIKNGFALLTEERRANGIFGILNIRENTVISSLKSYLQGLLLSDKKMSDATEWSIDAMHIKTPSQYTQIRSLSGGNQQKVILGRWLKTNPTVLLLDEPTRGIDVGAKYEIYQLILNLAKEGKTVIMVSSEMPELLGVCDRILVMSGGRLAGEVDAKNTSQEEIMTLAAKYA